ncbi:MAG: DUF3298 domain-containing protein [Bacteroidales bacterium]|nr:DUF3298 domain-containing protein [Bacteroidales bacterium]
MKTLSKTLIFVFFMMSLLLTSCQHKASSSKYNSHSLICDKVDGICRYKIVINDVTSYLENSYSLYWPNAGQLSFDTEKQLIYKCFNDSISKDFGQACRKFLGNLWILDESYCLDSVSFQEIDTIPSGVMYSTYRIESSYNEDAGLGRFIFSSELYPEGAAHGLYGVEYINYDCETSRTISLTDLLDTTGLGMVAAQAIESLDVNQEVKDCLYEPRKEVPIPSNFFIDSTRSNLMLVYPLYEIAPYACGIQSVALPFSWLSTRASLTPYARQIVKLDVQLQTADNI